MENKELKLCKNCKHFRESFSSFLVSPRRHLYAKCAAVINNPKATYDELISGIGIRKERYEEFSYCTFSRQYKCGVEATLFEPKK